MTEPFFFGFPLHLLVLYFLSYSFLGWVMETVYCSLTERRFVARGFLYGPLCPIYGVGVLMMLLWFAPLRHTPLLFYAAATVCMSAWEYLVGWVLEATTHIKYWDYSMYRFNLHGRICLWVCLTWGLLAYLVIYLIHPAVSAAVLLIPLTPRRILAGVCAGLVLIDACFTVRALALMSRALSALSQTRDELRLQFALGRAELGDRLEAVLDAAPAGLDDAAQLLRRRYEDLLAVSERTARRFLSNYTNMSSQIWSGTLGDVRRTGAQLRARLRLVRRERRVEKRRRRKKH